MMPKIEVSRKRFLLISILVKIRKIKCPHCGSFDTIKKGKREGSSRHFCKNRSRYLHIDN